MVVMLNLIQHPVNKVWIPNQVWNDIEVWNDIVYFVNDRYR